MTPLAEPAAERPAAESGLTPDGRFKSGRLAGRTMWSCIWILSWPILIESYLNSLVGLTDTFLSAKISTAATDAIGAASYIFWFVGLITMAISIGATALVSRAVGAGRFAVARAAAGQSVLLAVSTGVLIGIALWLLAPILLSVYSLSGEAAVAFTTYLRIIAFSVPAMSILGTCIAVSRGAGDNARPLLAMVVVNVVNMVLSWILSGVSLSGIGGNNGFGLNWGIAGIGWGTVIGEYIGAGVVLWFLVRGSAGVQLKANRLRLHRTTMYRLVRVGVPSFLETSGMWLANFIIVLMVRWLTIGQQGAGLAGGDSSTLGAHIVGIRIEAIAYLPGFAMGAAAATLAGQYLGARRPAEARRAVLRCMILAAGLTGLMGLMFVAFPRHVVAMITDQPVHLALVPTLLVYAGLVQIPFGAGNVLRSALRGAGDAKWVMVLTWVSTFGIRLPLVYALSGVDIPLPSGTILQNPFRDTPSLSALWAGLCIEIVCRFLIFGARFLHGGWAQVKV